MKRFLHELDRQNKGLKHRIFGAMQKAGIDGYKEAHFNLYDDPDRSCGAETESDSE